MPMPSPQPRVVLKNFPGLVTKSDPEDIPVGSGHDQVNVTSQTPGELRVRPGLRQLVYEDG